jgi:sugar O-acyltransferase (sialic acid O-acetyltransferase NeuD family)
VSLKKLWVLGDSGLAREVEMTARAIDPRGERWLGISRVDRSEEADLLSEGGDLVMGIAAPHIRARVAARLGGRDGISWPVLVHPWADVEPTVALAAGVVVASGSIVTVDVEISAWSMLNLSVTVGHDARIGQFCMINPQAVISGNVSIEDEVLIGAGAVILEGRRVGNGATIGAGALVATDVEPGSTVVGAPARPIRRSELD